MPGDEQYATEPGFVDGKFVKSGSARPLSVGERSDSMDAAQEEAENPSSSEEPATGGDPGAGLVGEAGPQADVTTSVEQRREETAERIAQEGEPGSSIEGGSQASSAPQPVSESMLKEDLLAEAQRRGIEVPSGATKPDIVRLLNG